MVQTSEYTQIDHKVQISNKEIIIHVFTVLIITCIIFNICMMNIILIKTESKNNDKFKHDCTVWQMAKICIYSNWTDVNNTYVARVDTSVPVLTGIIVCKKLSCITASSDTCYYRGSVFQTDKKCFNTSTQYQVLAGFNFAFITMIILILLIHKKYPSYFLREMLPCFIIGAMTTSTITIIAYFTN